MAAETLRTDRVYNVKEAHKETVVFEDGAEYLNKPPVCGVFKCCVAPESAVA
jgi:hypothetical protein